MYIHEQVYNHLKTLTQNEFRNEILNRTFADEVLGKVNKKTKYNSFKSFFE